MRFRDISPIKCRVLHVKMDRVGRDSRVVPPAGARWSFTPPCHLPSRRPTTLRLLPEIPTAVTPLALTSQQLCRGDLAGLDLNRRVVYGRYLDQFGGQEIIIRAQMVA